MSELLIVHHAQCHRQHKGLHDRRVKSLRGEVGFKHLHDAFWLLQVRTSMPETSRCMSTDNVCFFAKWKHFIIFQEIKLEVASGGSHTGVVSFALITFVALKNFLKLFKWKTFSLLCYESHRQVESQLNKKFHQWNRNYKKNSPSQPKSKFDLISHKVNKLQGQNPFGMGCSYSNRRTNSHGKCFYMSDTEKKYPKGWQTWYRFFISIWILLHWMLFAMATCLSLSYVLLFSFFRTYCI